MAKIDLGEKRTCAECAAKFFDLKKRPVVCPKCGFSFDPDAVKGRAARKVAPVPKPKAAEEDEADDSEDAETVDEDAEGGDDDQKELSLDDESLVMGGNDENDDGGSDNATGSSLPDGYTEEGVEDDSDSLNDDEDEDVKLADQAEMDGED